MSKIIEIKQIANLDGRLINATNIEGIGEFTVFPYSIRSYVARKNPDGTYITGLEKDKEAREKYERILGVDLSPTSDFWSTFRVYFTMEDGKLFWNLDKPTDFLQFKMSLANKFLALDKETLKDDGDFLKTGGVYYVFDEEATQKRSSQLAELKDEISSLLYKDRQNQERLLYLVSGLGKFVLSGMSKESLYNILSEEKEKRTKLSTLENLRDHLKKSNEELQAMYYVREAIPKGLIRFDSTANVYKYELAGVNVGATQDKIKDYFANPKNVEHLAMLVNEVRELKANK